MQTLITILIILGLVISILWFFTGFRLIIKQNKYLVEKDYYLQWYNPKSGRIYEIFIGTL